MKEIQFFVRNGEKTKTKILDSSDAEILNICYNAINNKYPRTIFEYFREDPINEFEIVKQFIKCNINPEDGMLILYNNEFIIKHKSFCPIKATCPLYNIMCVVN